MKKPILWLIISSFIFHAGFSDPYVWQDYDDFSGSSLDTRKWEIGYWDGAQAPNIENGKAHLYGTGVGVGSIVPPSFDELVGMPQNGTNQSFLFLKDDLISGVEAEISLDSTYSGIYLGIMESVEGGSAYAGIELNSWKQSGPSLEFSNTVYENGTETLESTLGDKPASLEQSYKVSVVKGESAYQLFLDSELIGEYPVRGELLFFVFGGYHDEDLPWDGYIDNVRVISDWEDYDDFSGTSLDSTKWGIITFNGGIEPYHQDGSLILSSNGQDLDAVSQNESEWNELVVDYKQWGDPEVFYVIRDTDIVGVEASILMPAGTTNGTFFDLSFHEVDSSGQELTSRGIGIGLSQENGNTKIVMESEGETFTEEPISANLGQMYSVSIIRRGDMCSIFLNEEQVGQISFFNFQPNLISLSAYNENQQGFAVEADNVRVLRRANATTVDGSVLILSSTDGVSETLSFENGTFTSTFIDPEEGTFVDTDKSYTLDQVSDDIFKIILDEGDTYEFNEATGTGSLVDYENGVIDTQGTWSFTFERHDWEDYDDFSSGSLDSSKWDVWWGAGGELPVVSNGALKLSGTGNEVYPASSVIPDDLTYTADLPSKHSVALINQDDIYGMQAEFMIPSNPSDDTGLNFIFFDWASDGSKNGFGPELEYRLNSGLRTEFAWTDPDTGVDEQLTRSAQFDTYYKMSLIHTDSTNSMYLNGELIEEFSSAGFSPDTIGFAAFNDDGLPYETYVKNVRVLRRNQTSTEPDPVTVVSDPNGQAVVVQVGDEYKWNDTLDGVTLWGVWEDYEDGWIGATLQYENGMQKASIGLTDELGTNLEVNHPYIIDENGMIKVTEATAFQYYQVTCS